MVKNWQAATVEDIRNWASEYGLVKNVQMQNRMVKVSFESAESAAEAVRDVRGRPSGVIVYIAEAVKNPPGALSSNNSVPKESAPFKVQISVSGGTGSKRLVRKSDDCVAERIEKSIPLVDLTLSDEEQDTHVPAHTPFTVPVDCSRKGLKKSAQPLEKEMGMRSRQESDQSSRSNGAVRVQPKRNHADDRTLNPSNFTSHAGATDFNHKENPSWGTSRIAQQMSVPPPSLHYAEDHEGASFKSAMRKTARNPRNAAMQSLSRRSNIDEPRISYKILSTAAGSLERVVASHVSQTTPEFFLVHKNSGRNELETILTGNWLEKISVNELLSPDKVYALKVGPVFKRVKVLSPSTDGPSATLVQLIDSGAELPASRMDLCNIPEHFAQVPPLALRCTFASYAPKSWDTWCAKSLAALIISDEVALTAKLVEMTKSGLARVVLRDQENNDVSELLRMRMDRRPKALFVKDMPKNFDPRTAPGQTFTFSAMDTRAVVYMQDEARLPELCEMWSYIGGEHIPVEEAALTEGMFVLAVFDDGLLYRASVLRRLPDGSIVVRFIDYGTRRKVARDQLYYIPADLAAVPAHAVKMRLWHVDDRPPKNTLQRLTIKELGRASELMRGKSFTLSFVEFASTGEPVVRLHLDSEPHFIHNLKKKFIDSDSASNYAGDMTDTVELAQRVDIEVVVMHVVPDGETVHVMRTVDLPLLDDIDAVGKVLSRPTHYLARPGEACMISIDGDSFRAVKAKSGETYRRLDFGDVVADVDEVFPLPSGLDGLPALAVECKIQGGIQNVHSSLATEDAGVYPEKTIRILKRNGVSYITNII